MASLPPLRVVLGRGRPAPSSRLPGEATLSAAHHWLCLSLAPGASGCRVPWVGVLCGLEVSVSGLLRRDAARWASREGVADWGWGLKLSVTSLCPCARDPCDSALTHEHLPCVAAQCSSWVKRGRCRDRVSEQCSGSLVALWSSEGTAPRQHTLQPRVCVSGCTAPALPRGVRFGKGRGHWRFWPCESRKAAP